MPLNHEINAALGAPVQPIRADLNAALMKRMAYVVGPGENPQLLDFTGADILAVSFGGRHFEYDSTDASTVHDGVTCIVTADGKRYKTDAYAGRPIRKYVIQDKDLTTPPGSPTIGQHWIVAAGATGDWAGQDDEIASYTARGWVFITPATYDQAFIVDEASEYHLNAGGNWVAGLPGIIIAAGSVGISELELGLGLAVENQTTNTPPGSPSAGASYIIGPSPTGAWAGNPAKLARYENSAWVIYTPVEGWVVRDKAQFSQFVYDGSNWVALTAGAAAQKVVQNNGLFNGVVNNGVGYTYSRTAGPTTANELTFEGLTITHTAQATGRKIRIEYQADYEAAVGSLETMAVFQDSETDALDWVREERFSGAAQDNVYASFVIETADTDPHEYKVAYVSDSNAMSGYNTARRTLFLTEFGPQ